MCQRKATCSRSSALINESELVLSGEAELLPRVFLHEEIVFPVGLQGGPQLGVFVPDGPHLLAETAFRALKLHEPREARVPEEYIQGDVKEAQDQGGIDD